MSEWVLWHVRRGELSHAWEGEPLHSCEGEPPKLCMTSSFGYFFMVFSSKVFLGLHNLLWSDECMDISSHMHAVVGLLSTGPSGFIFYWRTCFAFWVIITVYRSEDSCWSFDNSPPLWWYFQPFYSYERAYSHVHWTGFPLFVWTCLLTTTTCGWMRFQLGLACVLLDFVMGLLCYGSYAFLSCSFWL